MAEPMENHGDSFGPDHDSSNNDANYSDKFSISMGDLCALLAEEPGDLHSAMQENLSQGVPTTDLIDPEAFLMHGDLGDEKLRLKQWDFEGSHKENNMSATQVEESFNCSSCGLYVSPSNEEAKDNSFKKFTPFPNFTPSLLRHSASGCIPLNIVSDMVTENVDCQQYLSDVPNNNVPLVAAIGTNLASMQHEELPDDFHLGGRGIEQMKCEISPETGEVLEPHADNSPSLYLLQDGIAHSLFYNSELSIGNATDMCNTSSSCLMFPQEFATSYDTKNGSAQCILDQYSQPFLDCREETPTHMEDERDNQYLLSEDPCRSYEMQLDLQRELCEPSLSGCMIAGLGVSSPGILSSEQNSSDIFLRSESSTDSSPQPSSRNSRTEYIDGLLGNTVRQLVPDDVDLDWKQRMFSKNEKENQMLLYSHTQHGGLQSRTNSFQQNLAKSYFSAVDDDDADECTNNDDGDLFILHDIPNPTQPPQLAIYGKPHSISSQSVYGDTSRSGFGGMRFKTNDERLTFRLALQDLAQPKSEASPPEGVLAVPLLRHQRIALSWMVQKETASLHCSGGILADDQGLGKTISAIALILTERPSLSRPSMEKENMYEALDLDGDGAEAGVTDPSPLKQHRLSSPSVVSNPVKKENPIIVVKSRPAAGTLVVCPTSVLRQWAGELQNKVTSKADLSFIVYHGGNRAKDPNELAKYDVVLTTYAIVSMEVPKQLLVDRDDENERPEERGVPFGSLGNKKRKSSVSSTSTKKNVNSFVESAAGPLARVRWFRVILDEAQSIKNHRTQVARACWGLRAKRRWCLSGTPIQNAVDDLYSYFRFLRYDPYAVFKSFCCMIKGPISRNPTNGYKKLQAVLKTIMLRRTKGTLIDGKPIITLPPKMVALKKVDFSMEERIFYSTLEAKSREQFKVYAAAGTVKQNYVNILLMLLRLRQACDHPLLVKAYDSNSICNSSQEIVKKLERDKQQYLLSCLEANSSICTICNDVPEGAVVTICGHVFCNQCICEHLTGDDSICPATGCKLQLNITSIFSKGMLKTALYGLTGADHSVGFGPEISDPENPSESNLLYDSSKVKAALHILRSLPRLNSSPNCSRGSNDEVVGSVINSVDSSEARDRKGSNLSHDSYGQGTEKAIVFSQWTRMLDLLEVPLKGSCIQYRRLDGTMSVAARERAIRDFNTCPEVTVMIMSLKAASLGLNLVAACHVLLLDLWWNPTTEDQAIDRAHRIGQTRPVSVSRLTIKDTVEDRILALQEKKRQMVSSAFGEDESGSRQTRLTVEDLKYLFMV